MLLCALHDSSSRVFVVHPAAMRDGACGDHGVCRILVSCHSFVRFAGLFQHLLTTYRRTLLFVSSAALSWGGWVTLSDILEQAVVTHRQIDRVYRRTIPFSPPRSLYEPRMTRAFFYARSSHVYDENHTSPIL